eukprot:Awhi_evm1s10312
MLKSLAILAIASNQVNSMHTPVPVAVDDNGYEVYEALALGEEMCTPFDEVEYENQNWNFEDDIVEVLAEDRRRNDPRTWPDNTLIYEVTDKVRSNYPKIMNDIEDAIEMIEGALGDCIKIREKRPDDKSYVSIDHRGSGCSSAVGRRGGVQGMNLAGRGSGCGSGSTVHEFFHAFGMFHGQSRPDRDELIIVHEDRIKPETLNNFRKVDINVYGSQYDFNSIMHYGSVAFPIRPGQPTMTRKSDGGTWRQNRSTITASDIQFLRGAYKCDAGSKPPPTQRPGQPGQPGQGKPPTLPKPGQPGRPGPGQGKPPTLPKPGQGKPPTLPEPGQPGQPGRPGSGQGKPPTLPKPGQPGRPGPGQGSALSMFRKTENSGIRNSYIGRYRNISAENCAKRALRSQRAKAFIHSEERRRCFIISKNSQDGNVVSSEYYDLYEKL